MQIKIEIERARVRSREITFCLFVRERKKKREFGISRFFPLRLAKTVQMRDLLTAARETTKSAKQHLIIARVMSSL